MPIEEVPQFLGRQDCFLWIALKDPQPEELDRVHDFYELPDLAVEDARHGHQRPKLEEYGDSLFVALHLQEFREGELHVGELNVFVGLGYVVSVRTRSGHSFLGVRARCEREPELLQHGPVFVLYALMDAAVDGYFPILDRLETELERIEDEIFDKGSQLAEETTVEEITHAPKGFAGPVGISIPMVADLDIQEMVNFVTGANEKDTHLINVNIGRDFQVSQFADLRRFIEGDRCPLCPGETRLDKGIEVGHTFKLGTKYSQPMGATYLDDEGKERDIVMGSYGIGVGRTVAAAIEQSYDENGIIFPMPIAPFQVLILPVNIKTDLLKETAEQLYQDLAKEKVEVLYDDREETPGVKFKEAGS